MALYFRLSKFYIVLLCANHPTIGRDFNYYQRLPNAIYECASIETLTQSNLRCASLASLKGSYMYAFVLETGACHICLPSDAPGLPELSALPERGVGYGRDCAEGRMIAGLGCYLFLTETSTWEEAQVKCQDRGAYLVSIETTAEMQAMVVAMQGYSQRMWIGLNDLAVEGEYVWESSGEVASLMNWDPGEPSGVFWQNCGQIYTNGAWDDVECHFKIGCICELPHDYV